MKNGVIYARCSHSCMQGSIEQQVQECHRFAKAAGIRIQRIFTEEAPGTPDQPQLANALQYCSDGRHKVSKLIVHGPDRLTRFQLDYVVLKRRLTLCGVEIACVASAPAQDRTLKEMFKLFRQIES